MTSDFVIFQTFGAPPASTGGGPMPPTNATSPSPSYPSGTKPGSMTVSHGPVPRPPAPTSSYQSYPGPRPPMYPGQGNNTHLFQFFVLK